MKSLFVCASALALLATPAVAAMTDTDCKAEWTKADANKDGVLSGAEAERFLTATRVAGKPVPADGNLTDAVFMENCKAGLFTVGNATATAPFEGANSFTENQAKERITAAGFTGVAALAKDDKGIWRGKAMKADKSVDVAVDFKGNVVAK